jgi:hypothetical protein
VSAQDPDEFRRVPAYLRGHLGEVVRDCGTGPDPVGRVPRDGMPDEDTVVTVRFDGEQVFGATGCGVWLHADLWVGHLERVEGGEQ